MRVASFIFIAFFLACGLVQAAEEAPVKLPAIQNVEIGQQAQFLVNGKPFFPIGSWLQPVTRYPLLRQLGFNVFIGNYQNQPPADEMAAKAMEAGGYAMPNFDGVDMGNASIFGWIYQDEPDLSHWASDAVITPGKGLRINNSVPLSNLVDGNPKTGAVIDPMLDGSFTIELKKPVTVKSLAVWLAVDKNETRTEPTEMEFLGDGQEILNTALEVKAGQQKFDLKADATFQKLEVRITAVKGGKVVWGEINEIEAFDAAGADVLKSEPYGKVNMMPQECQATYDKIKAAEAGKPVWLTLTVRFLPWYDQWNKLPEDQMQAMYPKWAQACDALGTDIYPIYGFNQPGRLLDNIAALKKMRQLAGPNKPLYIWIESCNGGQEQGPKNKVEPNDTRAEVWMSIIAGARGIGYFTHTWKPAFSDFACDEAMQAELKRLNTQITRLTPAICADPAKIKTSIGFDNGVEGHLMATDAADGTYIFAQNLDLTGKSAQATVSVEGLKAGTSVEVIDENRKITAADGSFQDNFEALAEHIYRIGP